MAVLVRLSLVLALLPGCSVATAEGVAPFCDVLLWHASEQTSSVWSSVVTLSPLLTPSSFSAENVDFGWSPGFRVGLGYEPEEPSWDVKVSWTCFRTSDGASIPTGSHSVVPEFFSGFVSGDAYNFSGASLDWSLTCHAFLLEAGRKIAFGESAWLRPSLGLAGAIIDQKIRLELMNSDASLTAAEDVNHDFWGLGPSFGIGGGWKVPHCGQLSLVGSLSGDLLFGNWNVNDVYRRTSPPSPNSAYGTITTSLKDSSLGAPVLRSFLGLEWARRGDITITGRAGYELQWWANQQRLPAFQQLPMHGDLTLQGLTCGVSVCF